MTERQMSPSDFFIPSSYKDASGKENKCYEVTRLGCDFLANKSTGLFMQSGLVQEWYHSCIVVCCSSNRRCIYPYRYFLFSSVKEE